MKATISLKQLRRDPREYIRLLNSGYEVLITEHNKPIARAVRPKLPRRNRGDIGAFLEIAENLVPTNTTNPAIDTVTLVKQAKHAYRERKFGRSRS